MHGFFPLLEGVYVCQASSTIIPSQSGNSSLNIVLYWPETEIEDTAYVSCPCGNMNIGVEDEFRASRFCGGDTTNGARWEMAYVAPCNFTDNARSICQIATVRLLISFEVVCPYLIAYICSIFLHLFLCLGLFYYPYFFVLLVIASLPC